MKRTNLLQITLLYARFKGKLKHKIALMRKNKFLMALATISLEALKTLYKTIFVGIFVIIAGYYFYEPITNCTTEFSKLEGKLHNLGTRSSIGTDEECLKKLNEINEEIDIRMQNCLFCEGKYRDLKARVSHKLGSFYIKKGMSDYQLQELYSAEMFFNMAKDVCAEKRYECDACTNAEVCFAMGRLHLKLSEFRNRYENLEIASTELNKALEILTNSNENEDCEYIFMLSNIYINLGIVYGTLYASRPDLNILDILEKSRECFMRAESTLENSNCKNEYNYALYSAIISFDRGDTLLLLSDTETGDESEKKQNISDAIELYESSKKYFNKERDPSAYASINKNLGMSYLIRYKLTKEPSDLVKVTECFEKADKSFTEDSKKLTRYALFQKDYGMVYLRLFEIDNKQEYLKKAEEKIVNALNTWKTNKLQYNIYYYAELQNTFGLLYSSDYKFYKNDRYSELAIKYYQDALVALTDTPYQYEYGLTNMYLGDIYITMVDISGRNKKNRLKEAYTYYTEALNNFSKEDNSRYYDKVSIKKYETQMRLERMQLH